MSLSSLSFAHLLTTRHFLSFHERTKMAMLSKKVIVRGIENDYYIESILYYCIIKVLTVDHMSQRL
jgi:hypothetical protein